MSAIATGAGTGYASRDPPPSVNCESAEPSPALLRYELAVERFDLWRLRVLGQVSGQCQHRRLSVAPGAADHTCERQIRATDARATLSGCSYEVPEIALAGRPDLQLANTTPCWKATEAPGIGGAIVTVWHERFRRRPSRNRFHAGGAIRHRRGHLLFRLDPLGRLDRICHRTRSLYDWTPLAPSAPLVGLRRHTMTYTIGVGRRFTKTGRARCSASSYEPEGQCSRRRRQPRPDGWPTFALGLGGTYTNAPNGLEITALAFSIRCCRRRHDKRRRRVLGQRLRLPRA